MKQEHTFEEVHHRDGSTGFVVGSEVGQLIVGSKSLSLMTSANTTCELILLADDVLVNVIYGLDISRIT